MRIAPRLRRYLVSVLFILTSLPVVYAQSETKPLSLWLPFFSSNVHRLRPNQYCPQNQIVDIQISNDKGQLNGDIASIDWDLDCPPKQVEPISGAHATKTDSLTTQKKSLDTLLSELISLLQSLPDTNIRIHTLKLSAAQMAKPLSLSVHLQKRQQQLYINLDSELFTAKLTINLLNNELLIESTITLDKLRKFIPLPESLQPFLNTQVTVTYATNLSSWQQGVITLNHSGELEKLADKSALHLIASLDLLTEEVVFTALDIDLTNIKHKISEQKIWETPYIKLTLAQPARLNLANLEVQSLALQLRIGRSNLLTKVARGKSQRIRIDKQKLPAIFIALEGQGSLQKFALDYRLALLNQAISGHLLYAKNKVQLQVIDQTLSVKSLSEALRSYLPELTLLEVREGNINVQLSAQYDLNSRSVTMKSQIKAEKIAGQYENILFDGVSANSELDYQLNGDKLSVVYDKQKINIDNLFVGMPIQAIQLDAQFNAGKAIIEHFKARLLGGRIDFDDFALHAPSQTLLNIAGVELSEVIKYSAYPEIESKGVIDGMLPLSLTAQGMAVDNGLIFARPPGGYIKVPENTVVTAMGTGNPALSLTMQLLTNFQFDTLQGVIGYTDDGESDLTIQLKGINPNVSGVQPINFNYSHQENILKLLKSLRFNEQLIRQIKESY